MHKVRKKCASFRCAFNSKRPTTSGSAQMGSDRPSAKDNFTSTAYLRTFATAFRALQPPTATKRSTRLQRISLTSLTTTTRCSRNRHTYPARRTTPACRRIASIRGRTDSPNQAQETAAPPRPRSYFRQGKLGHGGGVPITHAPRA